MHTTVYVPPSGNPEDARIFVQFTHIELEALMVAVKRYTDLAYYLVNDRRKEVEGVAAGLTLALVKFQAEMAQQQGGTDGDQEAAE